MYVPPAFRDDDADALLETIRAARLATFVTATADGPMFTPLPLLLTVEGDGRPILHGHLAKANPQWRSAPIGDGLAIFMGADAYLTPSWYATKRETGKVVPTWNYLAVEAAGPVEFFEDGDRLLELVTRLTDLHERSRDVPWAVDDAPRDFVEAQVRGIVGLRMPVTRLQGKRKLSQNKGEADRSGVADGLLRSGCEGERLLGTMIPTGSAP